MGDIVQIQNQKGPNALRWSKSGVVVEIRSHDQYGIRMDGSGRIMLRNRKFLRKIEPLYRRSIDEGRARSEQEGDVGIPRRSSRTRHGVDRFQAGGC